ncbi:hypothetical protein [Oceanithermus sp.]
MHWLVDHGDDAAASRMRRRARELLAERRRLVWITLPSARNRLLKQLAAGGALLGLEVAHMQRLRQRILAQARAKGRFISSGLRVARVARVLEDLQRRPPEPGEARLYAQAIAELKRFEVRPGEVPLPDAAAESLQRVYAAYEERKGEELDPEDVSWLASDLVAAGRWRRDLDAVFVSGYWELAPVTLSLLGAMERQGVEVWASLPEPPAEAKQPEPQPVRLEVWRAENPVHELRWLLARIKHDLLVEGLDPLEAALVVPPPRLEAVKMLAREYDLYLMDETYHSLAEEEAGKLLVDLLRFADHPTAEGLFLFQELAPLGREALFRGLAGIDALGKLARELDAEHGSHLEEDLQQVLRSLDPLAGAEVRGDEAARQALRWAERLLDGWPQLASSGWREEMLLRAREALEAGGPAGLRRWWLGLLQRVRLHSRQPAGLALLGPREVSGRHYRRAYVLGVVEGAYSLGEREDYFIPEEFRRPWSEVFAAVYAERGVLPRRLRGRDVTLWQRLRGLADEVVLTYPEADAGQPLEPERDLVAGVEIKPMGEPPLISRALSRAGAGYRPPREKLPLPEPRSLSQVYRFDNRYGNCGFRVWLEAQEGVRPKDEAAEKDWYYWLQKLVEGKQAAAGPDPEALRRYGMSRADWEELSFYPRLDFGGLPVVVHAGRRRGRTAQIYRFGKELLDEKEARKLFRERWAEVLFAERYLQRGLNVEFYYWPLGGPPLLADSLAAADEAAVKKLYSLASGMRRKAQKALEAYRRALVEARPGWHCRTCPFADICRKEEA